LISGDPKAIAQLKKEMKKYLQCKFETTKDFLSLDITHPQPGELTLSMATFTSKMRDVLNLEDNLFDDVLTPGRTDKKINRDYAHEHNLCCPWASI
jgi:hypothetical protein